jgi:putative oxygen-independent coproporphyrinogen III oxidase
VASKSGIYIHIPFCRRKCTYCNFNTTDFVESLVPRYVEAVAGEVAYWGERLRSDDGGRLPADTIYFGGGTPSIIEADQLAKLIASCRAAFDISAASEVTIEINPSTFSRKNFQEWIAAGVNRASVGVQSFIDSELISLSRTHTAAEARRTIDGLREAGFGNISLDLIAGLPGQTLADWQLNLREALAIGPEHLSLYLLEVKEGTQLFAQIKRGLAPEPEDDLAAEMYRMISDATVGAGYEHYEISNFALAREHCDNGPRPSPFRSRHNMKYWTDAPFIGVGCGAHSYDRQSRWVNIKKTESYIDAVRAGGSAIGERHELTEHDRAVEALFMGLRLAEGLDLEEFRIEYGIDVLARYNDELARMGDAGLIEFDGRRLKLTGAGRLLSNEVFIAFV